MDPPATYTIDVHDLCGMAAHTQTRLLRLGQYSRANETSEAHTRIITRYPRLRGQVAMDDPDVAIIVAQAVYLENLEQT